jgi:hypothetical protein
VNGKAFEAADQKLVEGDLLAGRYLLLQKGKRSYALVIAE